eukprot:TRINITY_DN23592_c0_g3_i1.p1 TRINITY_DN23592_c0_g3~~TRINITY_DN23592_c0_g3_i1.p1  ORF type:complete len:794 (-),score=194.37 TRINITY_DN23592_c0_g3_i1:95-2476(-)
MSTKKKVRLGGIDVDADQFALVVSYTTEVHHFDDMGNPVKMDSQPGQKVIRVPRNLAGHDIQALAQEVGEKCKKYIPASKLGEVEHLLTALAEHEAMMQRQQQEPPPPPRPPSMQGHSQRQDMPPPPPPPPEPKPKKQEPLLPQADVRHIDDYADQLYEDRMELKVHGAKCILRVCTEARNLEILAEHDTLLEVLSRELRENSKKSFELSVVIVCVFLCFSHFSQFHPILMQHQCGDVTMRVLEYESQRSQVRREDMTRRKMRLDELGDSCTQEDRKLLAKDEKKYKLQISRQSKLMHVCLSALLNLAEEISIEKKMVNRKMPALLSTLIDRGQEDLLIVTLTFMKKLSAFEENKNTIAVPDTLSMLVKLAQHQNVRLAILSMRVLFNLSFDENVRSALVESGIVKLLLDCLRNPPFRHIVLRLLYHFSMDDRCKSLMAYQRDGMIMLLQLVVHFPEPRVGKDLVALVVNLATHARAAEVMVQSGLFPQVMLRVLKHRDPLLCKVIRHVASHQGVLEQMFELLASESVRMSKWMHEFVRMAMCCVDNPDLLVEVLGTLANVTLEEVPWGELCEAGLVDLLTRLLVPSFSEDDIVLECVMLVSSLAINVESAQHIAGSRLPSMLQDVLIEKREDEEVVVQLLFAFQCLLLHEEVREVVLQETELAPCIMRFARARNSLILEHATKLLQLVAEYASDAQTEDDSPAWVDQVKAFRFEQHNAEWCRCVNRELSGGTGMSPGGAYGGYYDDQQDSGGEEEEFAFHWAGGDCADAQDLANRDWGNKDMDAFRTSRFVS